MMIHPRRIVREENGDLYLEQGKFKFPFSPPVYEPKTESSGWNEDDTVKQKMLKTKLRERKR